MESKKPIMKQYMSSRNKNKMDNYGQSYEMGISKLVDLKNAKYRSKKINMIADGVELAEAKKNFFNMYK